MNGTYSPEDNKLRLYAETRLDAELYARVKAAGFKYAPAQKLFVAPMWTPSREDLLIELCGEVGDEDTSLVERAEERAERFDEYSEHRAEDAERSKKHVEAITDNIPFGQPILVGHHSEKRARRDAQKIENGMRYAVKMWETSKYWEDRAKGAIRHAKYKERPDVRARRIKGLEADLRKQEKETKKADLFLKLWNSLDDTSMINFKEGEQTKERRALWIANRDSISKCFTLAEYPRELPVSQYEGLMSLWSALDDKICTPEQAQEIAIRVHTKGNAHRARWINHITNRLTYEKAMMMENGGTAADKTKPEKGGACKCWVSCVRGAWCYIVKVNKVSVTVLDNWGNGGKDFTRTVPFDKLRAVMTAAEVAEKRDAGLLDEIGDRGFLLKDQPTKTPEYKEPEKTDFDAMKETLKEGIKTVCAPQLFPTPPEIAAKMVEYADIQPGMDILEPSAGTGNLLKELPCVRPSGTVTAVEKVYSLKQYLEPHADNIFMEDFLTCNGNLGKFDRIIMNPPFENGVDIKHIQHAQKFLKPGGRLVALCANGPRQRAAFMDIAEHWEDLPAGSFKNQGTGVNVALMVLINSEA